MHDETDERRLREIESHRETGGVIHHGDGTSTRVGSKYGGESGRASSSDGREYRDDGFGRMVRDPMAERTPDIDFKGPQYPTWTPSVPTLSSPDLSGEGVGLQLKLGLVLGAFYLLVKAYEGLDHWFHTSPITFVPAFGGGLWFVWKCLEGWLRPVLLLLGAAFILLKLISAFDHPNRPGHPAAVEPMPPAAAVQR